MNATEIPAVNYIAIKSVDWSVNGQLKDMFRLAVTLAAFEFNQGLDDDERIAISEPYDLKDVYFNVVGKSKERVDAFVTAACVKTNAMIEAAKARGFKIINPGIPEGEDNQILALMNMYAPPAAAGESPETASLQFT